MPRGIRTAPKQIMPKESIITKHDLNAKFIETKQAF